MNIYVSNLNFSMQDDDLRQVFAEYGEVSSAKVIMDKFTNQSRGFGFVEMPDTEAAQKAISALDGTSVDSKNIKVVEARPKEDRPARSGGGYQDNGGGYKRKW